MKFYVDWLAQSVCFIWVVIGNKMIFNKHHESTTYRVCYIEFNIKKIELGKNMILSGKARVVKE